MKDKEIIIYGHTTYPKYKKFTINLEDVLSSINCGDDFMSYKYNLPNINSEYCYVYTTKEERDFMFKEHNPNK